MASASTKVPPGPPGRFLVGNSFQYSRDPLGFLTRNAREYGDVVRLSLEGETCYQLNHPALIEHVLRSNHQDFIKDKFYRALEPLLGRGLLTGEGDDWRRQRGLAQPAFLHQQVQRHGAAMVDATLRMLETWRDGRAFDVHEEMMRLTLEIVARTLFGTGLAGDAREVGRSLEAVTAHFLNPMNLSPILRRLPTPSLFRFRRAVRRLDRIVHGIIRRRRASGHDPGDLLSRLLAAQDEDGTRLTDKQLRDELVTLVLAGHETTALTLSYTFFLVGQHPEVEDRLAAELEEVLEGRPPTAADVPHLRYTDWVIRESMRLYPPAWAVGREALFDGEIGGYFLPKGTQIFLSQWVVHRDPRWFEAPLEFRPGRWDNDLARRLPRCAYFPFGDGPRVCIGSHFARLEATLLLATIAQAYRLEVVPGRRLELLPSITLRPKDGIPVVARARRPAPRIAEARPAVAQPEGA